MSYWLNGDLHDDPQTVHIQDRGFLLGDSLFETISVRSGAPLFFEKHMARLRASASVLKFNLAYKDNAIKDAIAALVEKNGLQRKPSTVRITLTRGAGARGIDMPQARDAKPTLLLTISPSAPLQDALPTMLMISNYKRAEHSVVSRHKTSGYLDNIMARDEARAAGADDAIMLNSVGRVACAAVANIYLIGKDGVVRTPPVSEGALPGVIREVLFQSAAQEKISLAEASIDASKLENSTLFITNSLIGVRQAVLRSDVSREGSGAKGTTADILQRVQTCYENAVKRELGGQ